METWGAKWYEVSMLVMLLTVAVFGQHWIPQCLCCVMELAEDGCGFHINDLDIFSRTFSRVSKT